MNHNMFAHSPVVTASCGSCAMLRGSLRTISRRAAMGVPTVKQGSMPAMANFAIADAMLAATPELRRRLASAKDSLRAAAQETKAAAAREAELQQELREAREELRASADATAEARRMQSYMEDMARELYDESQRAAALQDRFAALQAAAAGSAGTLRTFEERLEGQYREMEGAAARRSLLAGHPSLSQP
mmetsp:Transcript_36522/g.93352  ORF Transcript_36522/g.93352 Transcript_36522/m.93352 type:complete len:189 (+) Transcript_36522:200-766(+)